MTKWRKKLMPLEEWAPFQEQFGEFQLALEGDPALAMFCKGEAADELTEIYITGPQLDLIERFSLGGWEDSGKPNGDGVAMLVGTTDSWERFGIERGLR